MEFNLSEKIRNEPIRTQRDVIHVSNVKEFIKRLKEELRAKILEKSKERQGL